MRSVKSSHLRYEMYLKFHQKLHENEERLHLEKAKEVVLIIEREERNFANKNKQGHRV